MLQHLVSEQAIRHPQHRFESSFDPLATARALWRHDVPDEAHCRRREHDERKGHPQKEYGYEGDGCDAHQHSRLECSLSNPQEGLAERTDPRRMSRICQCAAMGQFVV